MHAIEFQKVALNGIHVSLSDVSFRAESGMTTCLTGPPGSGKSTVSSLIAGLCRADEGKVRVFGQDPFDSQQLRRRYHIVSHRISLPSNLFLDDYLLHASKQYGFHRDEARNALLLLDLWNSRQTRMGRLAFNEMQMAKFLVPLCVRPELVVIDGMGTVLGSRDIKFIYSSMVEMVKDGRSTLFITAEDSQALDGFADMFISIRGGRIVGELSLLTGGTGLEQGYWRLRVSDVVKGSRLLNALKVEGSTILVREPRDGLSSMAALLEGNGVRIISFERVVEGRAVAGGAKTGVQ